MSYCNDEYLLSYQFMAECCFIKMAVAALSVSYTNTYCTAVLMTGSGR